MRIRLTPALAIALVALACGGTENSGTGTGTGTGSGTSTGTGSGTSTGAGTGTGTGSAPAAKFELAGQWSDNFGGSHEITDTAWNTDYGGGSVAKTAVITFDNDRNMAVLQSSADDAFSPNKFSKNVWTELKDGSSYYCTVDFGLDTKEAALASTKTADATDPDTKGCGTSSWTKLTKKP